MPSPWTGRVIYCCPIHGDACDEADDGLWCPEGHAVSLTDMYVDRESDPWF